MGIGAAAVIFTFWTVFFTVLSVVDYFLKERDAMGERLARFMQTDTDSALAGENSLVANHSNETLSVRKIKEKLSLAGLKRKSDLQKYLLFQKICYGAPLYVGTILYFCFHASFSVVLIASALSGMVFIILPRLWLGWTTLNRRKEIKRFLPDTMDLFVVALEAGLSFDSALVRVAEEQRRVSTHISREFLYTNQEILVGKSREEALGGLAKRCGVEEIDTLVRAVLQSNKLGNSLVKTLRAQADSLRKKRKQYIHAQILKAPVKLIFPLIFFIFPTLLIVILAPALVQVFGVLATRS